MSSIPLLRQVVLRRDPIWQCIDFGERIVAAALLAALSPALIAVALITIILSGRSPLIAHRRVGLYGRELWVMKFRTMWERKSRLRLPHLAWIEYIDDSDGPELKGPRDLRVSSRFARFCRRHSIDELPQLVHVVLGSMSLVGPRPVTREELHRIYGADAGEVVQQKPGMAGLWQVSGRNRLTLQERKALDVELVRKRSPRLYFEILVRTIPEVLTGANSW